MIQTDFDRARIAPLRQRLTMLARGIRHSIIPDSANLAAPQSYGNDTVVMEGKTLRRKRIVLLAPGCSVATCSMCPLPNEALDPKRRAINPDQIIAQFEAAFIHDDINQYDVITIFNNGNFLVDKEIDPSVRQHIYTRIAKSNASILVIETLPQFITHPKLEEAKRFLGTKRLAAAIGLQSSNDLLREYGYIAIAFLMIKPPFLTEREAVEDTTESVRYLSELGIQDPILCATRVAPNTIVNLLYQAGQFNPPWIWSVVEIIKRITCTIPQSQPIIATSVLKPERNEDSTCAANCQKCTESLIRALEDFNNLKDTTPLASITCDCYKDYLTFMQAENQKPLSGMSIEGRIEYFLSHQEAS